MSFRLASKIALYSAVSGGSCLPRSLLGSKRGAAWTARFHPPLRSGYCVSSKAAAALAISAPAATAIAPKVIRFRSDMAILRVNTGAKRRPAATPVSKLVALVVGVPAAARTGARGARVILSYFILSREGGFATRTRWNHSLADGVAFDPIPDHPRSIAG